MAQGLTWQYLQLSDKVGFFWTSYGAFATNPLCGAVWWIISRNELTVFIYDSINAAIVHCLWIIQKPQNQNQNLTHLKEKSKGITYGLQQWTVIYSSTAPKYISETLEYFKLWRFEFRYFFIIAPFTLLTLVHLFDSNSGNNSIKLQDFTCKTYNHFRKYDGFLWI